MKKLLQGKFLPINHRQEAFLEYHNLTQNNLSVEDLIVQFDHLRMRCGVEEEEEQVIAHFLGILHLEISEVVQLQQYCTYTDVCCLALKVEKQQKSQGRLSTNIFSSTFRPSNTQSAKAITPKVDTGPGTLTNPSNQQFNQLVIRCFKCQGLGHLAKECPNKQLITFVDDPTTIYDTANEDESIDEETEIIFADRGEALITQRVFNVAASPIIDDNSWLRNNIFHTKCTAKGKVCNVIIDGGSCENMVATSMVEKLGLETENHPTPYQLTWLKKGDSNGRMPHLIRKALAPLDTRPSSPEALILTKPEFVGLTKLNPNTFMFALIIQEENKLELTIPQQVQPLLDEFRDVFPDDIPPGLPLMCKIQHCIDFLPDLIDQLHGSAVFSKIDLRSGYHQIRMRPEDEWKPDFKTRDGLYEWMVMPFGLSNAPSTFMRLMNHVFKPFIGHFVVVYFDDILVFNRDIDKHLWHLKQVFTVLRDQKLYANKQKCHFLSQEVTFLEYLISQDVECDASGLGIGGVLSQNNRPIAFFSEKFNEARRKYSTYDREFYAIVRTVEYWRHYLLPNEFILFLDHEALKFLNGQHTLKPRHAKWVETLQGYSFVIRHKDGSANIVADALSRRIVLLSAMQIQVCGFDSFRSLYQDDPTFRDVWQKCCSQPFKDFSLHDGYLFKGSRLCVPLCSLRDSIILESHAGGLAGHFERDKTLDLIHGNFYWPKMERDVSRIIARCRVCHIAKTHSTNAGLYTPLPVPTTPCADVSLDFVMGLPRTQRQKDLVMVVVDRFSKMAHFVPCSKTYDASQVARLYFAEILSSSHHPQTDGQTEVTNRSLGNLLRSLVGEQPKQWDNTLPHAEFAYNRSLNRTAGKTPFMIVYGRNPFTLLDLAPLPISETVSFEGEDQATQIKELHKQPRADGPFRILRRINDNAYKIELPGHYNVSATFNVADLLPYEATSDDDMDSGTSPFEAGEDDAEPGTHISNLSAYITF
ncbi:RNA-directed DNA polymerase [Tanacetum coccineum]